MPDTRPVAMFRGRVTHGWTVYDAEAHTLHHLSGPRDFAINKAREWCTENGYYLSGMSDTDDRLPAAEQVCMSGAA